MKKMILFLCLLLVLGGCTKTETIIQLPTLPKFPTVEKVPFDKPTGKAVNQPDTSPTWIYNNLSIKYESTDFVSEAGLTTSHQYIVVDGLLNNSVEAKINETIFKTSQDLKRYVDFKQVPNYRGLFKLFSAKDTRVDSIDISTYENFNFNNLLSVISYVCVDTNQPSMDQNGCSYHIEKPMTFDLNTGNTINLSDLFISGSDFVSRLNELIMMDIQNNDEQDSESYYVNYTYLGGFTGIRGDVGFYLNSDSLVLTFDQNYPEFFNDFRPSDVSIPYDKLKDILAFGQRFISDKSLFEIPNERKFDNYLTVNPAEILVETRDQTLVRMVINQNKSLGMTHREIVENIIAEDKQKIDLAVKNKAKEVWYKITAYPVGPYLNIDRILYLGVGEGEYLRVTYKPDGTPLTFSDVFRAGFDYKALIIPKMKAIATEHQFPDETDYEAVFKTMKVMIFQFEDESPVIRVFNKFQLPPVLDFGTFDVILPLEDYPNDILIKDWTD